MACAILPVNTQDLSRMPFPLIWTAIVPDTPDDVVNVQFSKTVLSRSIWQPTMLFVPSWNVIPRTVTCPDSAAIHTAFVLDDDGCGESIKIL